MFPYNQGYLLAYVQSVNRLDQGFQPCSIYDVRMAYKEFEFKIKSGTNVLLTSTTFTLRTEAR